MSNRTMFDDLEDISWWQDYYPQDAEHIKLETNLIFAGHKISDLYQVCSFARSCLHFIDNNNFGDFAQDDISKLYIKSLLVQNALIYYNIAVDFSWQFLWLYYNSNIIGCLPTNKLYQESLKDCNYELLKYQLTLGKDIKMRDHILKHYFDKSNVYQTIRGKYNYLKHRGSFHFPGLGSNYSSALFSIQGKDISLIARREMDIVNTKELLIKFDKEFVKHCNYIIRLLMPQDFKTNSFGIESLTEFYFKYREEIDLLPS